MMKKLLYAGLLAVVAPAWSATTISQSFDVTVNLTSACQMTAPAPVAFTYTSLQSSAATATGGGFTVTCTNSLPYKIGFTNTATPATTANGGFSNAGLNYSLSLSASTGTGSGVAQTYSIGGNMSAGQAGTCAVASCNDTDSSNTLYVVY